MSKTNSAAKKTVWGEVTESEDGMFLKVASGQEFPVAFLDESLHAIVTAVDGGFLAAWTTEDGEQRAAFYKTSAGATRKASESWGR